jgi:hypothetical protein
VPKHAQGYPRSYPIPIPPTLFTGSAASLLAATTARAATTGKPGDDAELIRLCADLDRLTLLERSLLAELFVDQLPLMRRIVATRAVTREGLRAKARSLVLWADEPLIPSEPLFEEQMIASVLSDLLGGPAA